MEGGSQSAGPSFETVPDENLEQAPNGGTESEAIQSDTSRPLSAQSKMEDSTDSIAAQFRHLQNRFGDVESKMNLVDTMYSIHEATKTAMTQAPDKSVYFQTELWGREPWRRRAMEMDFFKDIMFFLHRVRGSYEMIKQYDEEQRVARERASKKHTRWETKEARQVSTQAFLQGDRVKLIRVDWDAFVVPRLTESNLAPVEVISSEPDTRNILKLVSQTPLGEQPEPSILSEWDVSLENGGPDRERLLPERVKIRSYPLLAVLATVMKVEFWSLLLRPELVMIRPYRDMVYYEGPLREYLEDLEKLFHNFDGKWHEEPPPMSGNDESMERQESEPMLSDEPLPTDVSNVIGQDGDNAAEDEISEILAEVDIQASDSGDDGDTIRRKEEEGTTHDIDNKDNQTEDYITEGGDGESGKRPPELTKSITALIHLRCLLEFMDRGIKPKRDYIRSMECTRIHFHDLWYLFKPGDQVLEQGEKQAYVVLRVQSPIHIIEEPWGRWDQRDSDTDDNADTDDEMFTLHCLYIDFDGKVFGPVFKRFSISPFGGLKPVKLLPVYPLRFSSGHQTRQQLIERGKMLLDVAEYKAMYYMGPTIDRRDEIDSQVVIDFSEALADEERRRAWEPAIRPANTAPDDRQEQICSAPCCCNQTIREGLNVDSMMTTDYIKTLVPDNSLGSPSLILSPRSLEDIRSSTTELTNTELLLMTYRVFGFVLRSRKWAQLDMAFLRYENSSARHLTIDAFRRLELPTGHREMVQSLVTQHFRNKQATMARDDQTDLVQGKGKGLIMLLHGAPGVGKTTTAEGVSELFRKPLFQITCGDLGTTAREVEAELEKSFSLASRWGCILLLDEADVFLSTRERNDFTRNGLVAVFLRVLEYYTGILFLTTNRIGDLDEAFASRIHMSLHYPELDEQKTLKVFELHLDLIKDRFKRQGRTVTFDSSSINNFASQHFHEQPYNRWNGRQIRNACQTALALAEFDAQDGALEIDLEIDNSIPVALDLKYFLTVQRAYIDFSKYLADIQGTQGDRRAYDLNLRARTNTPFAAKQSRFDSISEEKRRQPQHHEARYSASHIFGSQTESFHGDSGYQQNYRPATQMHSPSHSVPHVHVQETSSGFRGYENVPAYGAPGPSHSQQAHMDSRLSPGRQQELPYEVPQGNIPVTYSGDGHTRPLVSSEGSPLPYRVAQHSTPHYGYSSGSLGGHQAGIHASGFAGASPRVQEGLADPTTSGYPTTPGGTMRISQQGNNMPQA